MARCMLGHCDKPAPEPKPYEDTFCSLHRLRNVIITGRPEIGEGVSIGDFSEVNAKGARVVIGAHCDIASFVAINAADSSDWCIECAEEIKRQDITIGEHVFIGSHCFIGGGVTIGHHSKVAAGTILTTGGRYEPYSLIYGRGLMGNGYRAYFYER